ncbi:MAG: 50S ribosomal protein L9 [Myxococcota bacterium]
MEIILLEDVRNLGEMGEIVDVSPGYGRNYLIPQGLAEPATVSNKSQVEHQLGIIEARREREREEAQGILSEIEGVSISVPARVTDEDKLYGSVGPRDVAETLKQQGHDIDRKQVMLEQPIDELGIYEVPIKLASGIYANIRLWVVVM